MIPAMRATPSTSPFWALLELMRVAATGLEKWTLQIAMAVRFVGCLEEMETMWASPEGVRWVRVGAASDV